jgi:hypothetical protein
MTKKIFFLAVFSLMAFSAFSQAYKGAVGVRGGWSSGFTGKYILKEGMGIEGIVSTGYRYRGWQVVGLFELYKPAFTEKVEGLFWFYGGGAHFGSGYHYVHYHNNNNGWGWGGTYHDHYYSSFGIDGIFGMEFKIPDIPFIVGADVKPFVDFVTDRDAPFGFWDSAVSIRYIFGGE